MYNLNLALHSFLVVYNSITHSVVLSVGPSVGPSPFSFFHRQVIKFFLQFNFRGFWEMRTDDFFANSKRPAGPLRAGVTRQLPNFPNMVSGPDCMLPYHCHWLLFVWDRGLGCLSWWLPAIGAPWIPSAPISKSANFPRKLRFASKRIPGSKVKTDSQREQITFEDIDDIDVLENVGDIDDKD